MSESYRYTDVELFTTGTVGPKGQRTFYVQFGNAGDLVTLKLEKGQVNALADYLDHLLDEVPDVPDAEVPLALDLIEPVTPAWSVASMGVAYQEDEGHFVVVAEEFVDTDERDDTEDDAATAEVHVSPGQVRAFIERARDLVAAGRPPCQYCGRPLDDDDNWCPCFN